MILSNLYHIVVDDIAAYRVCISYFIIILYHMSALRIYFYILYKSSKPIIFEFIFKN